MTVIKRPLEVPQTRINTGFLRPLNLFPLNRPRRLWRQVKADAVHSRHFFRNAVCDMLQKGERHVLYRSSHGVFRIHRAEDDRPLKRAFSVFYPDGFKIRDYCKVLPYLSFQTVLCKFLPQDRVRLTDSLQTVTGDRSQAAHSKPRPGNG